MIEVHRVLYATIDALVAGLRYPLVNDFGEEILSRWQGYGAAVIITDEHVVIERSGLLARTIGPRQVISLGDVVGFHVKSPSFFVNGWIQLCVGNVRPQLGRAAAPSDPHTVLFKRSQRDQMGIMLEYLQQLVEHNRQRTHTPSLTLRPVVPAKETTPTVLPPSARVHLETSSGPSFVGFDVETANSARGSICAIGLTVVRGGRITATHSWLCNPPHGLDRFEARNIAVHGITPRDVAAQPAFRQRLADMADVIGDLPLVAHNAAFDIGALREASIAEAVTWQPRNYGCTLIWARNELPDLVNHKLPTVARALGVELHRHHDASADATAASEIALALMRRRNASSIDTYVTATGITLGRATVDGATGPRNITRPGVPSWVAVRSSATPPAPSDNADPRHPLYGHTIVLTGVLSGLSRDQAWTRLAKCGARVNKTITRRTTVLIAGTWLDGGGRPQATEKLTDARRLQSAGQQIVIIDHRQMESLLAGERPVTLPDLAGASTVDAYALADDSDIAPQNRSDPLQQVRGRHYCAWVEPVKQLKRDNRLDEALDLLLEVIAVVERPENCQGREPAPWYTEQAAIVYRKQKNFAGEVDILQRWVDAARCNGSAADDNFPLIQRQVKAEALLDESLR